MLYTKPCYNESCYKEVVLYFFIFPPDLFELEFYGAADTVKIMSSWLINLLTLLLGRLSPLIG